MAYLFIRHEVEDYDEWKPVFDDHAETRAEHGSLGGHLFRTADDPNDLAILFEWDSVEHARDFAESGDLREAMERAGVSGEPDLTFLEKLEDVER